ncbi:NUDIX hydrolase [Dactylosporangium sp. NPDC051541]|uniref:NUDIX hydrolase n=1 Tax=Dactylosporangium sp. NPDC051541 TaxID=3363977 RepID=UPI0037A68258
MTLHSVSVAAVVTNEIGHVLVIQRRDNGEWQIPGGVLEIDESIPAGVRREVEEETGLLIEVDRLTGVYKNVKRGVVALVFRGRPIGGREQTTDESTAVEWWSPDRVATGMTETFAVRVLDALDSGEVAVRLHDGVQLLSEP